MENEQLGMIKAVERERLKRKIAPEEKEEKA